MSINSPATIKNGMMKVCTEAAEELFRTGAAVPDITNIIFNESTSKSRAKRDENGNLVIDPKTEKPVRETVSTRPTLATTVYFADGSKVTVTNSAKDAVTDADGKFTHEAYERGIIYALVKRIFSKYEMTKKGLGLKCEGFGRRLNELVANAYYVQKAEAARKAAKEAAHKAHLEREAAAKQTPRKRRVSLGDTVAELAKTVSDLASAVNEIKAKQEA